MKDLKGNMEVVATSEEFEITDNNHLTKADDKYVEYIDLSNACREFYQTRKRAAEEVKEKLANSGRHRSTKKKTSIDVAMETLRTEMASLMDQDLSLMKQLLTLNETIEELKWQKKHSQSSIPTSSCDLSDSDWSVSETDMYDSENEAPKKFPSSSPISVDKNERSSKDVTADPFDISSTAELFKRPPVDTTSLSEEIELIFTGKYCGSEQNSFDSGIHEALVRETITV